MSSDTTTVEVASNRARLSSIVQAVGRRPLDIERRWWESTAIFLAFGIFYFVVGLILVGQRHVVGFETLDRFNRALMIWHNDPQKLSAVGFDYPPLSVLLLTPLTVFAGIVHNLLVVPVASAIAAGYTMVVIDKMLRRATILFPLRLAVMVTLGLNPLVVMYATLGYSNFLWIALAMAAIGAIFAWYVTADIRFIMIAGLAYSIAALTGYGSLTWFLVTAIMVVSILSRLGADGTEVEGTAVGFASPTVYVITLWTAFNLIVLVRPFAWLTDSSGAASSGGLDNFSFNDVVTATAHLVFYGAPIAIVVLPLLVFSGIARRNGFALWLGLLLFVSIITPGISVLVHLTDTPMVMSNALPMLLISVVGAIWLARSMIGGATVVAAVLAAGLLVSIPWTFANMPNFGYQGIERAFHDAISTGHSQEGARAKDGSVVGVANEQDMARYINDHIADNNAVLTDNAQTFGVMFFSDSSLFFDRVDQSDGPWQRAAEDPANHVSYLLLSRDTTDDLLSKLYPAAAAGRDSMLTVVHQNARYTLVQVPAGFTLSADRTANGMAPTGGDVTGTQADQGNGETPSQGPTGGVGGQLGETGGGDGDVSTTPSTGASAAPTPAPSTSPSGSDVVVPSAEATP